MQEGFPVSRADGSGADLTDVVGESSHVLVLFGDGEHTDATYASIAEIVKTCNVPEDGIGNTYLFTYLLTYLLACLLACLLA